MPAWEQAWQLPQGAMLSVYLAATKGPVQGQESLKVQPKFCTIEHHPPGP